MRVALFALAAVVAGSAVVATAPVQAQDNGTRIIIRKLPPRSYLDPGPVVKPGTARDLNYIYVAQPVYPQYGDDSTITGIRWPLPSRFDLPGY
ncbi:hypothetical protein [Ancylobacter sp. IITR112]|uniref:hypothetical protein n=1 Tax=Ancylobacter sp. IITR112 TaxID=3138073 RepID=UPI00352B1800